MCPFKISHYKPPSNDPYKRRHFFTNVVGNSLDQNMGFLADKQPVVDTPLDNWGDKPADTE